MSIFMVRFAVCWIGFMLLACGIALWLQPHYLLSALLGALATPAAIVVGMVWNDSDF